MPPTPRHLHLLRHAKSSWTDPSLSDHDRPLAPRGLRAGSAMADHLSTVGNPPGAVLCSTAARTQATLDLVRRGLPDDVEVRFDRAVYAAWWNTLLDLARSTDDDVTSLMLIGHNPGVEDLAVALAGRGDGELRRRLAGKYPTCGLASLRFEGRWADLSPGAAELTAFVVPRDL